MKRILVFAIWLLSLTVSGQRVLPGVLGSSIQTTTSAGSSTLLTGLTAYWKLQETSGTNANDEVGSTDLTLTTGASFITGGKLGYGLDLSGASDVYAGTATTSAILPSGSSFTFACWVYFNTLTNQDHDIFNFGTDGLRGYANQTSWVFETYNTTPTGFTNTTADPPTIGTWYLVIFRQNGASATGQVIVNNTDLTNWSDAAFTGTFLQSTGEFHIGNGYWGATGADVIISEAGLWSRALTTTEMTNLYNSGTGITYPFTGF